jgi:hypothetical protein
VGEAQIEIRRGGRAREDKGNDLKLENPSLSATWRDINEELFARTNQGIKVTDQVIDS